MPVEVLYYVHVVARSTSQLQMQEIKVSVPIPNVSWPVFVVALLTHTYQIVTLYINTGYDDFLLHVS